MSWHYQFLGDTMTKVEDLGLVSMWATSPPNSSGNVKIFPVPPNLPLQLDSVNYDVTFVRFMFLKKLCHIFLMISMLKGERA